MSRTYIEEDMVECPDCGRWFSIPDGCNCQNMHNLDFSKIIAGKYGNRKEKYFNL